MNLVPAQPAAGLVLAVLAAALTLGFPAVVARLPRPVGHPVDAASPYPDLALRLAAPRARLRYALAAALLGGALGAATGFGFGWLLVAWWIPVGLLLAVIDHRLHLLPTALIAPGYAVTVLIVAGDAWARHSTAAVIGALLGWLVLGALHLVLWLLPGAGMGYGDVRLAGVLGMALGWTGWTALWSGLYAAFLIGGLVGLLRHGPRSRFAFGPYLLLGAALGVLVQAWAPGIVGDGS